MRALVFWLLLVAGSGALTFLCYGHVIGYGLTDMDTLMHIREGSVDGANGLLGLITEKLTGGRARVGANFYRPSVMVAYAGLRWAFGWTPVGYHLFDLFLHGCNGVLLGVFAAACARSAGAARYREFGAICAAGFLIHPLGVEVVPAIARNGDLLVTSLLLAALLALHRSEESLARGRGRGVAAWLSLFYALFAATLGAKEPGIVLAGAAWCYVVVIRRDGDGWRRAVRATLVLLPCLPILGFYFAMRSRVLGDALGGYELGFSPWFTAKLVVNQMGIDLLVPGLAHRLDLFVPKLYELPEIQAGLLLVAIPVACAVLFLLARRVGLRLDAPDARLLAFALAVILQFACVFALTGVYERRYLYTPAAFFSFFSGAMVLWMADFARVFLRGRAPDLPGGVALRAILWAAALALGSLHLAQSPLFHRYEEWESSGETTRLLTEGLRDEWRKLPDGARVLVINLPSGFSYEPLRFVMYLRRSSTNSPPPKALRAWLEDQFPGKRLTLKAFGYHRYATPVSDFRHNLLVGPGRVAFDVPVGWNEVEPTADDLQGFRLEQVADNRVALKLRGRPGPNLFLLVFDGAAPRFLPIGRPPRHPKTPRAPRS